MSIESEMEVISQRNLAPEPAKDFSQKVAVGPPDDWIESREVDWDYRPDREGIVTTLLLDHQHHAELRRSYHRQVQRLETLHAVHQAAQWKLDFDPETQRPTIHSIQVRRGPTVIDHTNPALFRYLQRETELERLSLHGTTTLVVILEDIRIGDILDVSYTIEHAPRLMADRTAVVSACPSNHSVRAFHFSVTFAPARTMRWLVGPVKSEPSVSAHGESTRWTWNLEKTTQTDPEENIPSWHLAHQWIEVTDCQSWEDVSTCVQEAWRENFDSPLLRETVQRLASEHVLLADRVEAALRFVQDDIRYLSHNLELGGHVPSQPERILRQRFGDCKDKSFLLSHLLRCLGVSARPVLVNAHLLHRVRDHLPMLGVFNHAVVEFEVDGVRRTVDPTIPLQGGGPLHRSVPNFEEGLPISPGVTNLERLANSKQFDCGYELTENFQLDSAGGPTLLKVKVKAIGRDADRLRADLALEGRELHAHRREQTYKQLFPEVRRVRALETSDDRERNIIHLTECYELVGILTRTSDRRYTAFAYRSHLIHSVLRLPEGGKRRNPFAVMYPCNLQHDIDIESSSIDIKEAQTKAKKDAAFRLSADTQTRAGRMHCRYRLQTFEDHVDPERFSQFRRRVEEAWRYLSVHVIIPVGVAQPRRRLATNLLHGEPSVKRPDAAASGNPIGNLESRAEVKPMSATISDELPATPAGPLGSLSPNEETSGQEAAATPIQLPERAPAQARESKPAPESRSSGRRHRSRRRARSTGAGRQKLIWGFLACLAFICIVIIIAILTRD